MKNIIQSIVIAAGLVLALPAAAFAHVVVTPSQTVVAADTLFTVSVPNERSTAVNSITLAIPSGVEDVQPNVMAGWTITTTSDKNNNVTAITWAGTIPVGQRADLVFKAQAPATQGKLDWKASQTYADGTIVRWDQTPVRNEKDNDSSTVGPYSVTTITNDLSAANTQSANSSNISSLTLVFSIAALILSLASLFLRQRRSNHTSIHN